ncbi:MAG TPA: putative 4-mercaptohistidine N1-methyltransferase [Chthoniobacterales bacterium]|jgi:putative 4-mercaptohistidine N1-methyltranferase|nr:putative 4-mercaptohistidine N1-methyltransferase [Chthoniobacterales bacterium]
MNVYETDALVDQYLLFHYGEGEDQLPYPFGPHDALFYPVRCVTEFVPLAGRVDRALDLGCAVGRSAFELTRTAQKVIGIDLSQRFISAAQEIQQSGEIQFRRHEEGNAYTSISRRLDPAIDRSRCQFEVGDALRLRSDLGTFDFILAANLIDRVHSPKELLAVLRRLLNPGGHLLIASPYTWLSEFTPTQQWLGAIQTWSETTTLRAIRENLGNKFELVSSKDLPFLIREHARKYQWSVAQASLWLKR